MTGHHAYAGFGIMSRVRPACSHQHIRTTWASEQPEQHNFGTRQRNKSLSSAPTTPVSSAPASSHSRQRNHSVSHTVPSTQPSKISDAGHWPPLEFDPLKLNPTVVEVDVQTEKAPPRLYERDLLRTTSLRTKKTSPRQSTSAGFEPRTRPRLHHSDSGISFNYDAYSNEKQFNFAEQKAKALHGMEQQVPHESMVDNRKGWPSPASSVDSGKSWFDLDDDDDDDVSDDEGSVTSESEVEQEEHEDKQQWAEIPSPQRRPQVGSPDDPTNYLKRGAWKRRGIFFGQQTNEVYEKEDDAFDI